MSVNVLMGDKQMVLCVYTDATRGAAIGFQRGPTRRLLQPPSESSEQPRSRYPDVLQPRWLTSAVTLTPASKTI